MPDSSSPRITELLKYAELAFYSRVVPLDEIKKDAEDLIKPCGLSIITEKGFDKKLESLLKAFQAMPTSATKEEKDSAEKYITLLAEMVGRVDKVKALANNLRKGVPVPIEEVDEIAHIFEKLDHFVHAIQNLYQSEDTPLQNPAVDSDVFTEVFKVVNFYWENIRNPMIEASKSAEALEKYPSNSFIDKYRYSLLGFNQVLTARQQQIEAVEQLIPRLQAVAAELGVEAPAASRINPRRSGDGTNRVR